MTEGYRQLREGAALVGLGKRGRIRVAGEDRVRLLHALTSNHVEQLQPGTGCYAFFLDAQGHTLADVNVLCEADALTLDTEPETGQRVYEHVDRYIIADDVTLEDLTIFSAAVGIEGPEAGEVLSQLGAPVPDEGLASAAWGERRTVLRASATGGNGWWVFLPPEEVDPFATESSLVEATAADVRTVRLENAHPRYGDDISEAVIPHETQLLHAVHFSKGCYLGQEIVERVHSRGHVNRLLVQLKIDGNEAPAAEVTLLADDKAAGKITSAAYSPAMGCVVALGYVRAEHATEGSKLWVNGVAAEVTGTRPR